MTKLIQLLLFLFIITLFSGCTVIPMPGSDTTNRNDVQFTKGQATLTRIYRDAGADSIGFSWQVPNRPAEDIRKVKVIDIAGLYGTRKLQVGDVLELELNGTDWRLVRPDWLYQLPPHSDESWGFIGFSDHWRSRKSALEGSRRNLFQSFFKYFKVGFDRRFSKYLIAYDSFDGGTGFYKPNYDEKRLNVTFMSQIMKTRGLKTTNKYIESGRNETGIYYQCWVLGEISRKSVGEALKNSAKALIADRQKELGEGSFGEFEKQGIEARIAFWSKVRDSDYLLD